MDLRKLDEPSLEIMNQELNRLVELQNGQIDFAQTDLDLEDAEQQALNYIKRRENGYKSLENREDDDIRPAIRDFLKKRSYRNENQTRDLSITYPEF